jgi:hypothetical protein
MRRGAWKKTYSYTSPHVPSVHNRRSQPQVRKVTATLETVPKNKKIVVLAVSPLELDSPKDGLAFEDALRWQKKYKMLLRSLIKRCPGLLHSIFQVSASRDGFFSHGHLIAEVDVDVLPEQVAEDVSRHLGAQVNVRSDAEEQAMIASFFASNEEPDEPEGVLEDGLPYVLPKPEDLRRGRGPEFRARYYLRLGIELHPDLETSVAGEAKHKDPSVRACAGTPGNASIMSAALGIILLSHFGRCFRSYGRARQTQKDSHASDATPPTPLSVGLCSQSHDSDSTEFRRCNPSGDWHEQELERVNRERTISEQMARKEAFFKRGWGIKGAYWSREWVGAGLERWRRWLHILVEVLPGASPPTFEDLFDSKVWPSGEMVTVGDIWREEMTRSRDVAIAA